MDSNDAKLLTAIHEVKEDVRELRTKLDDSVNGRFIDNERRIHALEANQRWITLAVLGSVIGAVLNVILN